MKWRAAMFGKLWFPLTAESRDEKAKARCKIDGGGDVCLRPNFRRSGWVREVGVPFSERLSYGSTGCALVVALFITYRTKQTRR